MKRQLTPFLAVLAVLLTIAIVTVGDQAPQEQTADVKARMKEHGKLFNSPTPGKKLTGHKPGESVAVYESGEIPVWTTQKTRAEQLKDLACGSDAVLIVKLTDQTAALTEDESFVFTDYTASVEEILRNNPTQTLQVSSQVIVTRPGGSLVLDGVKISARMEQFREFVVPRRYLLYLRFVPSTNSYVASGSKSFELREMKYFPLAEGKRWKEDGFQVSSFLGDARKSAVGPCQ